MSLEDKRRAHQERTNRRAAREQQAKIDKDEFMRIGKQVMSDETILPVNITIKDAWMLISALQLATRHPKLPKTTHDFVVSVGHQFQNSIVQLHPEAEKLLERGWDTRFDIIK